VLCWLLFSVFTLLGAQTTQWGAPRYHALMKTTVSV